MKLNSQKLKPTPLCQQITDDLERLYERVSYARETKLSKSLVEFDRKSRKNEATRAGIGAYAPGGAGLPEAIRVVDRLLEIAFGAAATESSCGCAVSAIENRECRHRQAIRLEREEREARDRKEAEKAAQLEAETKAKESKWAKIFSDPRRAAEHLGDPDDFVGGSAA